MPGGPFSGGLKFRADTAHSRRASPITDIVEGVAAGKLREIALVRELAIASFIMCAVQRHGFPAGANPARQLSFQPVAIGAVVEVTKRLKPPV